MNPLTESMAFKWLMPVRGGSRFVHYVFRDQASPLRAAALCGQMGEVNRYGVPTFRRLYSKGTPGDVCNGCHAEACRKDVRGRVDWKSRA